MRNAIDSYTADKQKAPQSLDDLVQDGYLKAIPEDPMTHSKDTWQTDSSSDLSSTDQTEGGINNVHSGSQDQGSDGQPYSSW
jgi:general secretion pathway protein G